MSSPEDPRVPWYIDTLARHRPRTMRLLAYMALAGRQGVLGNTHCRVTALTTPGAAVAVAPGAFGVLNTAVGGEYEAYVDKFGTQLLRDVPATDATPGGRTDLVVLRVENPSAVGTGGSWAIPEDPENGPYWDVRVIPGVTPNINSVVAHNPAWTAIPLARITRPANTGIVQQSHIHDLRSLVDLSGERIIIVDNPPPTPPPIAQTEFGQTDVASSYEELIGTQGAFVNFPNQVAYSVPVPSWAVEMDFQLTCNMYFINNCWGEVRLTMDGSAVAAPVNIFDYNWQPDNIQQADMRSLLIAGKAAIPAAKRGKIVEIRPQARFLNNVGGSPNSHSASSKLMTGRGCVMVARILFKRYPTSD